MNKKTKGAIAAGAAALLLAGGAGSFALWSDTENVVGGTVTSGHLQFVEGSTTGAWYKGIDTTEANKITDIAAYRIVPGETLTYKATAGVQAEGTNLSATLELTGGNVADGSGFTWAATAVTVDGNALTGNTITPNDGTTQNVVVTKSVTFDAADTDFQGVTADLNDLTLTLEQTS